MCVFLAISSVFEYFTATDEKQSNVCDKRQWWWKTVQNKDNQSCFTALDKNTPTSANKSEKTFAATLL